jgi:hypothetical protein
LHQGVTGSTQIEDFNMATSLTLNKMVKNENLRGFMQKVSLSTLLSLLLGLSSAVVAQNTRDVHQWPFSKYSIWNMPIGSNAQYVAGNMPVPDTYAGDIDYMVYNTSASPRVVSSRSGGAIPVDDGHIVGAGDSRNKVVNVFPKDGFTFQSIQPGDRHSATGDFTGYLWRGGAELYPGMREQEMRGEHQDIRGHGIEGAHWGSGMNAVLASIRVGDLHNDTPIRHALGIEVSGWKVMHHDKNDLSWNKETGDFTKWGFRWPADRMDGCAGFFENGNNNRCYFGSNPAIRMGALFAIPPTTNCENIGLQTKAAKKMCWTMQNYGAYLIDDSYGMNSGKNIVNFAYLPGVNEEFNSQYGYPFDIGWNEGSLRQQPFFKDLDILIPRLSVIVNNGPTSIGGGGNPRQCFAPPFANGVQDLVAVNPNGSVQEPANCDNPIIISSSSQMPVSSSSPISSSSIATSSSSSVQTGTSLTIEAESANQLSGLVNNGTALGNSTVGSYAVFNNIDFGTGVSTVAITYGVPAVNAGNKLELRIGSISGTLVASLTTQSSGDWGVYRTDIVHVSGLSGVQDLYLVYAGGGGTNWVADVDKLVFEKEGPTTSLNFPRLSHQQKSGVKLYADPQQGVYLKVPGYGALNLRGQRVNIQE